jgi:hypothetical protein
MNTLESLVTKLETASLGESGKTLFIDDIPAGIDNALMIRMNSSQAVNTYVPLLQPTIQVIKRATTTKVAIEELYRVISLLHVFGEQTWGTQEIVQCHCLSEPQFIGKDESGRVTYSTSFQLWIRWTPEV